MNCLNSIDLSSYIIFEYRGNFAKKDSNDKKGTYHIIFYKNLKIRNKNDVGWFFIKIRLYTMLFLLERPKINTYKVVNVESHTKIHMNTMYSCF